MGFYKISRKTVSVADSHLSHLPLWSVVNSTKGQSNVGSLKFQRLFLRQQQMGFGLFEVTMGVADKG